MTFKEAEKVKIGDTLYSKDGYCFVVGNIETRRNVAYTRQYLFFKGISTRGIEVGYDHKQIQ